MVQAYKFAVGHGISAKQEHNDVYHTGIVLKKATFYWHNERRRQIFKASVDV
jgi:hypothetical protein